MRKVTLGTIQQMAGCSSSAGCSSGEPGGKELQVYPFRVLKASLNMHLL